jgi:hypothetical protein
VGLLSTKVKYSEFCDDKPRPLKFVEVIDIVNGGASVDVGDGRKGSLVRAPHWTPYNIVVSFCF